jgi:hypothetical protein
MPLLGTNPASLIEVIASGFLGQILKGRHRFPTWGDCANAAGRNLIRIAEPFGFRSDKIANGKSRVADRCPTDGR